MDRISIDYLFYGIISTAVLIIFLIVIYSVLSWCNNDSNRSNSLENEVEYQPIPIIEPEEEIATPIIKPRPRKRKKPTAFAASVEGFANRV
jgi:type IV pilus biogenesis protein CpaD/CtpE